MWQCVLYNWIGSVSVYFSKEIHCGLSWKNILRQWWCVPASADKISWGRGFMTSEGRPSSQGGDGVGSSYSMYNYSHSMPIDNTSPVSLFMTWWLLIQNNVFKFCVSVSFIQMWNKTDVILFFMKEINKLVGQFGERQETLTNKTTTAEKQTHAIRVVLKLRKNRHMP